MAEKKYEADDIYDILKNRIIHLEYDPGQVLNEVEVADEFNTSRTPIRRVFQQLHSHKLLNIVPRFGAQVAPIDFKKMKSIFEVTREMDPFATRLAVERISDENLEELKEIVHRLRNYSVENYQEAINDDEKFHHIILTSCGNPWLQDILMTLHFHTERLWHYCEQYFDSMDLFSESLSKVVEAIAEKDYEKAEKYSREHIDAFVAKIKSEML